MRIMRSKQYRFRLAEYESMDVMSSVTVDSTDMGVSEEEVLAFTDEQSAEHVKALGDFCNDTLLTQLEPLLEEARYLAHKQSSAIDVEKYNEGLRA